MGGNADALGPTRYWVNETGQLPTLMSILLSTLLSMMPRSAAVPYGLIVGAWLSDIPPDRVHEVAAAIHGLQTIVPPADH